MMRIPANGGQLVPLDSVCKIVQGGRQKLSGKHFIEEGGYPAYGAGGHNGNLPSFEFDEPAVVLSAIGARCGKCFQPSGKWSSLANTSVFFPAPDKAEIRFLWYQLNDESSWHRSGTAQPYIKPSDIKGRKIYLPPLAEQKRIAGILDAADALRAKRRESLAQLDTLLQSTFLTLFGDPVTNPMGWVVEPLGEMCDVRDGTHDSPKYVEAGHPLLTSKNFKDGQIDCTGANLISDEDFSQINKRSKVDVGDLVMPMIGTIGKPVLVEQEPDFAIKNVALIKFSEESPDNRFIRALLCSHYFDHITSKANRGGTQKFVALKDLRGMPIPLPPLDLQRRFAAIIESVERQKARVRAHLAELDALFASLQSRAFDGEL